MQPALFVLFLSVLSTSSAFEVLGIFGNNQKSNYTLVENWTGKRFINDFTYWNDHKDKDSSGNKDSPSAARYVSRKLAVMHELVKVKSNGNFVMRVEKDLKWKSPDMRPSVRITSKKAINQGILVLEAAHLPYGKGVWPSFWLTGADKKWPDSGEVDIYQGVGDNTTQNSVSYHTSGGCSYDTAAQQSGILSKVSTDCDATKHNIEACGNVDPNEKSYGAAANSVGGGVYILWWTKKSIKTFFFEKAKIPKDIKNNKLNPNSWGTPVTDLTYKNCDIEKHFGPMNINFNIELCGTWGGHAFPGGSKACVDFVRSNPDAMKQAKFEIVSLKYFQHTKH